MMLRITPFATVFIAACAVNTPANAQFSINSVPAEPQSCIAPNQFVELDRATAGTQTDAYGKTSVALGSYERVSPDGRFVLRSSSTP